MSGHFLADLLQSVAERGRALAGRADNRPSDGVEQILEGCRDLISGRGEATGMAIAQQVLAGFGSLDEAGQLAFFEHLAQDFGPDAERLSAAVNAWKADPSQETGSELHFSSEPRRQELFRRLNRAPGGTAALVAMRKTVLTCLKAHRELQVLDRDLYHLLSSWFNRGFLSIRRIDWSTPANILEKIIRYEAVHEISDWQDLRNRIDSPDRRCYGFFHPALADEPLIFVEVALTREIPEAIAQILGDGLGAKDLEDAKTAVFYSISNCQKGLKGVSFGSFLIKQVVSELSRELPSLRHFATLSPVPGFRRWLDGRLDEADLAGLEDKTRQDALRSAVMPLAAQYFLEAKTGDGEPLDPVARFHLGNGARLERINWMGDTSSNGLMRGAGLMVNYLYVMEDVEKNHESYANRHAVIASPRVIRLLPASRDAKAAVSP